MIQLGMVQVLSIGTIIFYSKDQLFSFFVLSFRSFSYFYLEP